MGGSRPGTEKLMLLNLPLKSLQNPTPEITYFRDNSSFVIHCNALYVRFYIMHLKHSIHI